MQEQLAWPPRKEDLQRLYVDKRLSAMKIAAEYGLKYASPRTAESTVLYHLKRNGIVRRDAAEHIRRVSPAMVDGWVARYGAGESLRQIASGEFSAVTVWNHLNERGVVLRDKVEAQIKAVSKYERKPFDGSETDKAYLMGLRYGDLNVVRHGRAIRVRLSTTHPAMADLFEQSFSPYGHVSRYPRAARLTGYEWSLECDLDASFIFLLNRPTISELAHLPKGLFQAFYDGFFDAEGTLYVHRKYGRPCPELNITSTDAGLLRLFSSRLSELGVSCKVDCVPQPAGRIPSTPASRIWKLRVWRAKDLKILLEQMNPKHEERVKKLVLLRRTLSYEIGVREFESRWTDLIASIKEGRLRCLKLAQMQVVARRRSRIQANPTGAKREYQKDF